MGEIPIQFPSSLPPARRPQVSLAVAGTAAAGLQALAMSPEGQNSLRDQELCSQKGKTDLCFSSSLCPQPAWSQMEAQWREAHSRES